MTVHAWLHLVDYLEEAGPLPAYWCFSMERKCGVFARSISSRKHPHASLDRRALEQANIDILRNVYDLQEVLPRYSRMHQSDRAPKFTDPEYDDMVLLHPCRMASFKNHMDVFNRIAAHFVTLLETPYFKPSLAAVKKAIPDAFEMWARLQMNDGDLVYAHESYKNSEAYRRDATFIQYELRVDQHARHHNVVPVFDGNTFFGQLERIIVLHVPRAPAIGHLEDSTVILLDVHMCHTTIGIGGFAQYCPSGGGVHEIVDANGLRAVVGRIKDRGKWVFVRRKGGIEHADYDDD